MILAVRSLPKLVADRSMLAKLAGRSLCGLVAAASKWHRQRARSQRRVAEAALLSSPGCRAPHLKQVGARSKSTAAGAPCARLPAEAALTLVISAAVQILKQVAAAFG